MIYRIYYNKRGDLPWSIDQGIGTIEHHAASITAQNVSFCSSEHHDADNVNDPRAWIVVAGTATWDGDCVKIKGD